MSTTTATTTPDQVPLCPWCKTANHVRTIGHRHFYCGKCRREFDGVDDGDISYGRPEKRMERQERGRQLQQQRKVKHG